VQKVNEFREIIRNLYFYLLVSLKRKEDFESPVSFRMLLAWNETVSCNFRQI